MTLRPAAEMASRMRSGSFHSNAPLALTSILRHSKRCLTQWKPPSLASAKSRVVVSKLPHRNTCTAGSIVASPGFMATGDGDGEDDGAGDAAGLAWGVGAGGAGVSGGGADVHAVRQARENASSSRMNANRGGHVDLPLVPV